MDDVNVLIRRNVEEGRTNERTVAVRNGSLFAPQLVQIAVLFTHRGTEKGREGEVRCVVRFRGKKHQIAEGANAACMHYCD